MSKLSLSRSLSPPLTKPLSATMSGGLHARQNSIKRTPSDLSLSLAAADLPPPSAITRASQADKADAQTQGLNNRIGELDLDEPEGESPVLLPCSFLGGTTSPRAVQSR